MHGITKPRRAIRHSYIQAVATGIQQLSQVRKDSFGIKAVCEDWLLIGAAGSFAVLPLHFGLIWGSLIWPIAWLVIGTRMRGLATLVHESSHSTLTKSNSLGVFIGTILSAWPIMQLLTVYRHSHVGLHHRFLGDEQLDPDINQYVLQRLTTENPKWFIIKHVVFLLLGVKTLAQLPYLLRHRLFPTAKAENAGKQKLEVAGFLAFWLAVILVVTLNHWWLEFLVIWIIPYLTVFQAVGWLIETSEHFPLTFTEQAHIHMTRNRKGNAVERFFFGIHGEGWHRVHHERPGIAFPLLEEAHNIMMQDPEYARSEGATGGLLTKGKNGEPSIVSQLPILLKQLQS